MLKTCKILSCKTRKRDEDSAQNQRLRNKQKKLKFVKMYRINQR